MERTRLRQPVAEALALLPERMRERVACDFLIGVDPVFVGLHFFTDTDDGRKYGETAHVAHSHHQEHRHRSDRAPTVVLPYVETVHTVVHELGHVLDESLDWERHTPDAVSAYSETNTWEAFAEAFTLWAAPELCARRGDYRPDVLAQDAETLAFFEDLAR